MVHPYARNLTLACLLALPTWIHAQTPEDELLEELKDDTPQYVVNTFNGIWNVNNPTTEIVGKGDLSFSIVHRFGDIGGPEAKGVADLFGIDFVRDYRLSLDYGITDRWMVGIGRSKQQARFDASTRYQILRQEVIGGSPVTVSTHLIVGMASETNTTNANAIELYEETGDRLDFLASLTVARKFGIWSIAATPMYLYRNRAIDAQFGDRNGIWALGISTRLMLGKKMALTADYTHNFSDFRQGFTNTVFAPAFRDAYFHPIGIGYEVAVGGHVFQLHMTNNIGVLPNAYLVNNRYDVADGRIRFGFLLKRVIGTRSKKEQAGSLVGNGDPSAPVKR